MHTLETSDKMNRKTRTRKDSKKKKTLLRATKIRKWRRNVIVNVWKRHFKI